MPDCVPTIVSALLICSIVAVCNGSSLYEKAVPYYASDVVWMTDCECDCPAVNTVHEKIKQSENATTLLLSVTQPCRGGNIDIQDFNLYFDDTGLLFVEANISRGDKTSISRQYQTPPIADIDNIKAIYTNDKVLQVTIPYLSKSQIFRYNIKVAVEDQSETSERKENKADTASKKPVPDKTTSKDTETGTSNTPRRTEQDARSKAVQAAPAKEIKVHDETKSVKDLDHEVDHFGVWDDSSDGKRAPGAVKVVDQGKVKSVAAPKKEEGANVARMDKTPNDNKEKPANGARLAKDVKVLDANQNDKKLREIAGKPAQKNQARLEKDEVRVADMVEVRKDIAPAQSEVDRAHGAPSATKVTVDRGQNNAAGLAAREGVADSAAVKRQIEMLELQLAQIQAAIRGELVAEV